MIKNVVPAVYLVLENEKGEYLFMRRSNTGYGDGCYSLPAGHVEFNESPLEAVIRETKEEIDLDIKGEEVKMIHVMFRQCEAPRIDFFFFLKMLKPSVKNNEPEKCDDLKWSSTVPDNALGYIRELFERLEEGSVYSYFMEK